MSLEKLGQAPTLSDLSIPLLYFVVPMALLLLLGVRFREMGFGRGYRSWAVILLFSVPMLILIALKLMSGEKALSVLLFLIIQNSLRSGFFEEFLFRGPLLSRLNLLFGKSWGVVLSTLIFGLFHVPTYTAAFRGDLLAGIALSLVNPVVIGLCFAIIVLRTQSFSLLSDPHHAGHLRLLRVWLDRITGPIRGGDGFLPLDLFCSHVDLHFPFYGKVPEMETGQDQKEQ